MVGHGPAEEVVEKDLDAIRQADIVFAIGDALDSGTIYEVGYARALGTPVVFYAENESEEDQKMMEGSGCILSKDYVTAIYKTLWVAAQNENRTFTFWRNGLHCYCLVEAPGYSTDTRLRSASRQCRN